MEKWVPGHFAERHFAERHFAERTLCRRTLSFSIVLIGNLNPVFSSLRMQQGIFRFVY